MVRLFIAAVFMLMFDIANGQDIHFIYIQTEDGRPFYIRWKDSIISSSQTGYLVVSNFENGKHLFSIGFPQNTNPSTSFLIPLENRDLGFLIKSNKEKGLVLENFQTQEILASEKPAVSNVEYEPADAFSALLVEVTGDSSVLSKKAVEVETAQIVKIKTDSNQVSSLATSFVKPNEETKTKILRLYTRLDSAGRLMTYVVPGNMKNDTVVLFIPYPKTTKEIKLINDSKSKEKSKSAETVDNKSIKQKNDTSSLKKSDTTNLSRTSLVSQQKNKDTSALANKKIHTANDTSNICKSSATERDFINLRRKMVDQHEEGLMQEVALQAFRKKCYTALQIKNLCVLFLKEKTRIAFLKSAYPFVKDRENYYLLQSLLTDPALAEQFRLMFNQAKGVM
jgi:hypothetical protein